MLAPKPVDPSKGATASQTAKPDAETPARSFNAEYAQTERDAEPETTASHQPASREKDADAAVAADPRQAPRRRAGLAADQEEAPSPADATPPAFVTAPLTAASGQGSPTTTGASHGDPSPATPEPTSAATPPTDSVAPARAETAATRAGEPAADPASADDVAAGRVVDPSRADLPAPAADTAREKTAAAPSRSSETPPPATPQAAGHAHPAAAPAVDAAAQQARLDQADGRQAAAQTADATDAAPTAGAEPPRGVELAQQTAARADLPSLARQAAQDRDPRPTEISAADAPAPSDQSRGRAPSAGVEAARAEQAKDAAYSAAAQQIGSAAQTTAAQSDAGAVSDTFAGGPSAGGDASAALGLSSQSLSGQAVSAQALSAQALAAPAGQSGAPAATAANAAAQVALAVAAQKEDGTIELRMDPPELGRVRLEIRFEGGDQVAVTVQAERPETLETLRRAAAQLERDLAEAGLDLGSLDFAQNQGFANDDAAEWAAEAADRSAEPKRFGLSAADAASSPTKPRTRPVGALDRGLDLRV